MIQDEAEERIGRQLSEYELFSVKKSLEWGLLFDIDTVFKAAIENAVEINKI
ncbi:MAG: hypothetical protein K8R41_09300 [Bacteroidales bacterium]|nr:hypothetical protein [Bacteroidales bacterium]